MRSLTVVNKYPRDGWSHVCTDGSSENNEVSGTGLYCENVFAYSCAVNLSASYFEADIGGINQLNASYFLGRRRGYKPAVDKLVN